MPRPGLYCAAPRLAARLNSVVMPRTAPVLPVDPGLPALPRVGVFDSGVGGLSVLRALYAAMPDAQFLYVADSGHAPYGERSDEHVLRRSMHVAQFLSDQGVDLMVVACNTATAVAIDRLRALHPGLPFVGVEPGVRPGVAATRNGRVAVMATPATLSSERFRRLAALAAGAGPTVPDLRLHLQPCPGLAAAIEAGDLRDETLAAVLDPACAAMRDADVDTVVLGCTHYPFVADQIARRMPAGVTLIDTADAVARQARRLLPMNSAGCCVPVQAWSSGDPQALEQFAQRWLPFAVAVHGRIHAAA